MSFSEWKKYRVGDIAKVKNGFAFKGKDFISSGVPVIKIKNVKPGKILLNDLSYVSREVANNASKYKINVGDILITMSGNRIDGSPDSWVGKVAMFREEGEYLLNQRVGIIEINSKKIDSIFLSYLLSSIQTQQHFITKANSSGGQANISPDIIHDTEFFAPDLPEQKQIASILRSIDDTIENNQQINKTLEEMAKAIFKEWFVDFNFPNATGKFQETEIGKIPVGWKVYTFGDLIDTVSETYRFGKKEKIIFLNTGDILDGEFLHRDYSEIASLPGQAKKSIKQNDILFSEIRPANKRFAFVNFDADEYVVSTKLMVLRSKGINPRLVYFLLTREEMLKQLQHLAESRSGTFPQITFSQLKDLKVALPQDETLESFVKILEAYYNQAEQNIEENQSLINLRDTLLPKLMKGEININL